MREGVWFFVGGVWVYFVLEDFKLEIFGNKILGYCVLLVSFFFNLGVYLNFFVICFSVDNLMFVFGLYI